MRGPRILVFQHMSACHPGIFRDLLRADGIAWDAVALEAGEAIPDLEGYDALARHGRPDGRLGRGSASLAWRREAGDP